MKRAREDCRTKRRLCFALIAGIIVLPAAVCPQVWTASFGTNGQNGSESGDFARTVDANGICVKVARVAGLWNSTDGSNWVERSSGTVSALYDIAYGKGTFVAVGNEGVLVTSSDGASWIARDSRTDERLRGVAFGNGTFVAVGYGGTLITSSDGLKWKLRKSYTDVRLQTIVFDRGSFLVLGWDGVSLVSSNGIRWTARTSELRQEQNGPASSKPAHDIKAEPARRRRAVRQLTGSN
jgi:hypothetical protein